MSKPQPRRVPSDDCVVTEGGVDYTPHADEFVEVIGSMTVADLRALNNMRELGGRLEAIKGEVDEYAQSLELLNANFDQVTAAVANRLLSWTWTDDLGRPLPAPDGTPGPLLGLRAQELYWLVNAIQGETPAERKNGSRPSPTGSSVSARRRNRT